MAKEVKVELRVFGLRDELSVMVWPLQRLRRMEHASGTARCPE